MLSIKKNPENDNYRELIDVCFEFCDEFHLVVRTDMGGDISGLENSLKAFDNSFKVMKKESEWASTILGDDFTADVHYFEANNHAKSTLQKMAKSLFEWEMPRLPEDLSFFKDGEVWMATSSHEKQCFIYPKNENESSKVMDIKGLKIEKISD